MAVRKTAITAPATNPIISGGVNPGFQDDFHTDGSRPNTEEFGTVAGGGGGKLVTRSSAGDDGRHFGKAI